MVQHRDDSKAQDVEGRTGAATRGAHSVSSHGENPGGARPRASGYGLNRVPTEDEMPAEERTFSQSGGSGSQPGMGKRLATDEIEDIGHFDRGHMGRETDKGEGKRNRAEGAARHGARPK